MRTRAETPFEQLPEEAKEWLKERFRIHALHHFKSADELFRWCDQRDLLAYDQERGRRSLRASTAVEVYRAIRQMVVELEYPDINRELRVLRQRVAELREENALLHTNVAVLSAQLRAVREGSAAPGLPEDLD